MLQRSTVFNPAAKLFFGDFVMSTPEARPPLVPFIRAALGFTRLTNLDLLSRLGAIRAGMKNNPYFPYPPVEIEKFDEAVEAFNIQIALANDGGRTAIAERNARREIVSRMAEQLGHYVEHNCNGEMDRFLSSGFQPKSTTRTPAGPLDQPRIRKIKHGMPGELLVYPTPVKGAYSYELGHSLTDENRIPGEWIVRPLSSARAAVTIDGLIPGRVYAFRIRALGKLDYTNWSDPAFFMCT
jgi:hypothetical protein